jgi:succinoglycan biosynthesis protein ExoL
MGDAYSGGFPSLNESETLAEDRASASTFSERPKRILAYFAPDFTEVSTITRARSFREHGFDVVVFAFRRARYNQNFNAPWREIEFGHTTDGRYLDRAIKLVGALPVLWRHRSLLRRTKVLYARNIDQLLLAVLIRLFTGSSGVVVYEVLDVSGVFTRGGWMSAAMRWAERQLLRRINLLVVSSSGFHENYFDAIQRYEGPVHIIENRLHPEDAAVLIRQNESAVLPRLPRDRYKWVVGYFGLIRGPATFDLMARVAQRCPEVLFYLRGVLTTIESDYFMTLLLRNPNIIYRGDYVNPGDLRQLYGAIDFSWAIDLEREDTNSRWLLPCRFFESSLLGVPSLSVHDFELGRRIESLGVGWAVRACYEDSLVHLFKELTSAEYDRVVARLRTIPATNFIAGEDVARLCSAMTPSREAAQ